MPAAPQPSNAPCICATPPRSSRSSIGATCCATSSYRAESRAIAAELKHRVRSGRSALDYAQSLLSLRERIGLDKVTYLVTVQLIAISGVPG